MFNANSLAMVGRLLDHWDAAEVELVQADIASLAGTHLPEQIVVSLIDVDLEIPVYEALVRITPRLVQGGIVLVDDCPEKTTWPGARAGYSRFIAEMGQDERSLMGMGLLQSQSGPFAGHDGGSAKTALRGGRLDISGT